MVDTLVGENDDMEHQIVLFISVGIIEWVLGEKNGQWMSFLTRDTLTNAGRLAPPPVWHNTIMNVVLV